MALQLNHLFKKHNELATFITSQNSSIEEFFANSFTQNQEPHEIQQNIQNLIVVLDLFGLEIIDFDIGILKIANAVRFCEYPRDLLFQALHSLSCRLKVCHLNRFSDAVSSIIFQAQQILSNNYVEQKSSSQSKSNTMKERQFQRKKLFNEPQEIEADKENQISQSSKKQQLQEVFYFEEIFEEDKQELEPQENINPADLTIQEDQEIDLFSTPQFCQFNQSEMLGPNQDSIPPAENSWTFNRNSNQHEGMYIDNSQGQVLNQTIYQSRKILQEINIPQQSQGKFLEKVNFRVQRSKGIASSGKMAEEIVSAKTDSPQISISPITLSHQYPKQDQKQFQEFYQSPQLIPEKPIQQLEFSLHQKYQPKSQGLKEDSKKLKNTGHKLDSFVIRKPNSIIESQIQEFRLNNQIQAHQQQQQSFQLAQKEQFTSEMANNVLEKNTTQILDRQAVEMLVESSCSEKKIEKLDFPISSYFRQAQEDILELETHGLPENAEKQQAQQLKEQKQLNQNETSSLFLEQTQDYQDILPKNNISESTQTLNSHLQQQQDQQQYNQEQSNNQEPNQQQQYLLSQQNLPLQYNQELFIIEIERRQDNSKITEYDKETALKGYQDSRSKSAGSVLTDIQGNHVQINQHPQDIINNVYVNEEQQFEVFRDQMTLPKENRVLLQDIDDTIDKHRLDIRNRNNNDQTYNVQVNPFLIPQNLIVNDSENNNEQLGQGQIEEQNGIMEEQRRRSSQRRGERNNENRYFNRDQILEEYFRQIQELRFCHDEQQQSQGQLHRENEINGNVSQSRNIEFEGQDDIAVRRNSLVIDNSNNNNSNNQIKQISSQQENRWKPRKAKESTRNIGICRWIQKQGAFISSNRRIIFLRGFLSDILQKHILKGFEALSTERKSMVVIASITVGMTIIL